MCSGLEHEHPNKWRKWDTQQISSVSVERVTLNRILPKAKQSAKQG